MVVGAIANEGRDRGEVVFPIRRAGIFAFGPLYQLLPSCATHDRSPAAVAKIIAFGAFAVVVKVQRVPGFVRRGIRDMLKRAAIFREDKGGNVGGIIEDVDVGDSCRGTGARKIPVVSVTADADADSIGLIRRRAFHKHVARRLLRRHVDVKRHVVFAHAQPYLVNIAQLLIREARRIPVDVVSRRRNV